MLTVRVRLGSDGVQVGRPQFPGHAAIELPSQPVPFHRGRPRERWVAVHHGDNHVHIVATLARQDGRRARLDNDFYRIGEALRDIEAEYGV